VATLAKTHSPRDHYRLTAGKAREPRLFARDADVRTKLTTGRRRAVPGCVSKLPEKPLPCTDWRDDCRHLESNIRCTSHFSGHLTRDESAQVQKQPSACICWRGANAWWLAGEFWMAAKCGVRGVRARITEQFNRGEYRDFFGQPPIRDYQGAGGEDGQKKTKVVRSLTD